MLRYLWQYKKLKNPKTLCIVEKTIVLFIICSKCENEDEKIFKKEESTEILKILDLFKNIQSPQKYKSRMQIKNIDEIFFLSLKK